ncbi:MAG: sensor histidine kinase, partial [Alphaproteobacteria bacterium]
SGDPLPVDVRAALLEVREQATLHIVCYDLSEHRLLVQAEKMAGIGQLAAGIAHEIRNPLGIISNALYDLGELLPDASPEVREDLEIARAEMARVQDIIGNLLEFSRDSRIDEQSIDLDDLVARTLKLMDKYLQNNGIRVQVDLASDAPCVANENGLRQVLLNLVTNAAQAMPDGGTLRIETRPVEPSWVRLVVEDTGQGIPSDRLPRIFEPFFTTKDPGQGTGLGLSVVHSIVKRARGRIEVASRPGRGTRFTIHLPRQPEAAADTEGSAGA